jgi:hypothetical protein
MTFCTFDDVFRPQILITHASRDPKVVIAELDPAIHAAFQSEWTRRPSAG